MGQLEPPRRALDENVNAILTVNAASFLEVGFGMSGQVTEFGFAFELCKPEEKLSGFQHLKEGREPDEGAVRWTSRMTVLINPSSSTMLSSLSESAR